MHLTFEIHWFGALFKKNTKYKKKIQNTENKKATKEIFMGNGDNEKRNLAANYILVYIQSAWNTALDLGTRNAVLSPFEY